MRRLIISCAIALTLALGAAATGAELLRDTLMMRAKDSHGRIVSIGGEIFHLTADTKFVSAVETQHKQAGDKLTLAELDVPETKGAKVPVAEPGIRVKYEAVVVGGRKELRTVTVYPRGRRSR